jgi:uncharacterized lipoprotein YmbA
MKNKKLPPKIKLTVIGAVWFLVIVIWALMLFGCASNKQESEMYDLLYRETPNVVYKSITIEDYKAEDVCSS